MGGPSYHLGLCLTASRRALDVGLGVGRWALDVKIHHGAGGQITSGRQPRGLLFCAAPCPVLEMVSRVVSSG